MVPARTPARLQLTGLPRIYAHAAGLDIGGEEIVVAVPEDHDPEPVRVFRTFTPDLHDLVAWLRQCGIDTVTMESTGIYWIPIYELLEQHGIVPYLVNARHAKTVPGRKSDWNDAQWLQRLHALGLLRASFRPDAEMTAVRTLVRYRAELVQHCVPHYVHMQQALKVMNLQVSEVLSDITGATGLAIIRAILAGERDPVQLAQHRNPGCKASSETIAKALTGTWKAEQLFVLQQSLTLYEIYTAQIAVCDQQIEQALSAMASRSGVLTHPYPTCPRPRGSRRRRTAPPLMHAPRLHGLWVWTSLRSRGFPVGWRRRFSVRSARI